MRCIACGKQIPNDEDVCEDCKEHLKPSTVEYMRKQMKKRFGKKSGGKK